MSDYVAKSAAAFGAGVPLLCTAPWARTSDGLPLVLVVTVARVSSSVGVCPQVRLFVMNDDMDLVPHVVNDIVNDFTFAPYCLKQTLTDRHFLPYVTGACWGMHDKEPCVLLAAGGEDVVKRWTVLATQPSVHRFLPCDSPGTVSASRTLVAVSLSVQRQIVVFDGASGAVRARFRNNWNICCLSWGPQEVALVGTTGRSVVVHDTVSGACLGTAYEGNCTVEQVTCTPYGWLVRAVGSDGKRRVFECTLGGQREVELKTVATSVAGCDAGSVVTADYEKATVYVTPATKRCVSMSVFRLAWMGSVVRAAGKGVCDQEAAVKMLKAL